MLCEIRRFPSSKLRLVKWPDGIKKTYHHPNGDAGNDGHEKGSDEERPRGKNGLEEVCGEFTRSVSFGFQQETHAWNL